MNVFILYSTGTLFNTFYPCNLYGKIIWKRIDNYFYYYNGHFAITIIHLTQLLSTISIKNKKCNTDGPYVPDFLFIQLFLKLIIYWDMFFIFIKFMWDFHYLNRTVSITHCYKDETCQSFPLILFLFMSRFLLFIFFSMQKLITFT